MDPITLFLIVALAGFVVFQVFQGRKRKRETEDRVSKFVPGVEIMTNYGLYGTIVEVDDDRNLVTLEVSPGVEVKIHKQTMLKVADYDDVAADDSADDITDDSDDIEADADVNVNAATDSQVTGRQSSADTDTGSGSQSSEPRTPIKLAKTSSSATTTPAFSAVDNEPVTEPAPAYGERIVAPTAVSPTSDTDASSTEPTAAPGASPRAPRKPATPRATTPRSASPRTPRAGASKPATPPTDDTTSDSSSR